MLGLLRTAVAAASVRRSATAAKKLVPRSLSQASTTSIPFVPADWIFRFFPFMCRDRVRYMLHFQVLSFCMGLGYFYLWAHQPYAADHYGGWYESPLYNYIRFNLQKNGQLEENLRIKRTSFYGEAA
mmetsp:Transcript_26392/g.76141  ORF Transcript_26392/g.76141 Transcript_26392/m.76141 type:complete len:127 (+) Transcript_26392:96-476(+)